MTHSGLKKRVQNRFTTQGVMCDTSRVNKIDINVRDKR